MNGTCPSDPTLSWPVPAESLLPSLKDLSRLFRLKHGEPAATGWRPRTSYRWGYFTPDDYYEATLDRAVKPGCRWLDVGCGRELLPGNPALAQQLAGRCAEVVGVDPDENVETNPYLHRRVRATIEDCPAEDPYDVITLRMVAEHVCRPDDAAVALGRLCRPGGVVIVYTVDAWSPLPVASWLIPFWLHHPVKRVLWRTEERDTFPVVYRMNTRKQLARLMGGAGFVESAFLHVSDCRTFARFRWLHLIELSLWNALNRFGLTYPERCLLGVYQRKIA
jgi:SAM-dependent methyltransferase